MSDQLADASLELAQCLQDVAQLQQDLADLQATAVKVERRDGVAPSQDVHGELDRVQEELAAAEERLAVAEQHLADDESSEAATRPDLGVLKKELSMARLALVEARQALSEQEGRLAGTSSNGGSQAVLLELHECREDVALLRDSAAAAATSAADGCAHEHELLAETRRRIAELAAENTELALQAAAAAPGTCPTAPPCKCPTAPPCKCDTHVASVVDTSSARPTRRTELLQNQLLADAIAEAQQLEEENERLKGGIKALQWETSTVSELKASLDAAQGRGAQLSEELARTAGALTAAQQRAEELQQEREALKSSLSNSEAHKATCNARAGSLVEIQRRLQEAANHAEGRLREADAACDKRLAAAEADAAKRLAAVETALAAAEKEKVLAAEERRGGDAALAAAEGARREAEVARATAEAELRFVREGKEAEIARLERLLAAHEEAERERQAAAQMMREAETGWLPLWAQRRCHAISEAAAARGAALQASLMASYSAAVAKAATAASSSWQATNVAVGGRLGPLLAGARKAAADVWGLRLRPVLSKSVRNWPELEAAVRRSASQAAERMQAAKAAALQRAEAAKTAANAAVLQQLQRVPQLQLLATPAVASAAVWGVTALVIVPLAWALVASMLRWLVFRLRPGSVAVAQPGSSSAWARLENELGYQFEQDAVRRAAVDGDSRGGTGRFAWLGAKLLQLLAAEAAFQEADDGAAPEALAATAAAQADETTLAERARTAGLEKLVQPGPGARSLAMGAAKQRELWAACLGAAFVDAGYELEAARKLYQGRPADEPTNGADSAQ